MGVDYAVTQSGSSRLRVSLGGFLYGLVKFVLKPLIKAYFRLRVEGLENIRSRTGFIIAANHASFLDVFIIGASVPQRPFFYIKDKYYRFKYLHWFFKAIECIEVKSEGSNREALRKGIRYLKKGRTLNIFPEGTRSESGELKGFRKGVAFLAVQSRAQVAPVYIDGTHKSLSRCGRIPRPVKITCCIGHPIDPAGYTIDELTHKLEKSIEELTIAPD